MVSRLAITLGDPAGIGPEVILKALAALEQIGSLDCFELVVVGSQSVLDKTYEQLIALGCACFDPGQLNILDSFPAIHVTPGQPNPETGAASFAYLEQAIQLALSGKVSGIVTGPISKTIWQQAGYDYPGQTEVLATQSQSQSTGMFFVGRSPQTGWVLRTLLATTHIPLAQVPQALTPDLLTQKLELLIQTLKQDFGLETPRIAIAGLNPHSGEQGKLGREEVEWMQTWLESMKVKYPQVELMGLVPPDTLWVGAGLAWWQDFPCPTAYDAYLALYHDQGLIPVKMLAFDQAVNCTLGLPFIRTSPDHGTAFDIAGRGIARSESMEAALAWAKTLSRKRAF
ncbi:4-hydroxythreonine-4-phosphate dehydrogenase PdxA [Pseudocalidococcus azoricus]|uniref:4-hydroxythreonine-4-phosphate dehydrogenase PdxA n=1 Tax=Pseudocalidococcus azoricus TaxID=3110322 RepID=UPI003899850E